jgi:hypothetical protein
MTETEFVVGKDVLGFCSKCELPLAHTIVSLKKTGAPHRVECNTCKGVHVFKDPNKVKKATRKRTRKVEVPIEQVWMEQMSNTKQKSQPYSIRGKFQREDVLDHKTFGPGIVQQIIDTKIEVLFRDAMKVLIHGVK